MKTHTHETQKWQASPPYSFVGELLAHLLRLLPQAATSLDGAATFIECLEPFEVGAIIVL